jgi:hypothetical protein
MTIPISHNTVVRLSKCATLLAKVTADLVEVSNALLMQTSEVNDVAPPRQEEVAETPSATSAKHQTKPASKAEVLASVKAGRDVIGQQNRPVQISILYREVSLRGFVIKRQKAVSTYAARIRDYKKRVGLIYLEGFGWWLIERPYPPANYAPESVIRIGKNIA